MTRSQSGQPLDGEERAESGALWSDPPTHKERTGVQRAVDRLLDALAPERTVTRAVRPPLPIERHRTPRGCILQAPAAAVTVSWFSEGTAEAVFGQLQITAWRGVVSRPGSAHRAPGGATVVRELTLRPEDREVRPATAASDGEAAEARIGEWVWRANDGTSYDTDELIAFCLALLEQQVADGERPAP